jgi:predicted RNA binding protein YcfA (HicA-like mRNA interferase family)
VKRKELIKILVKSGCIFVRHGKKHDIYKNTKNGRRAPIPRHTEIKNTLCELIKKQLGI